MVINDLKTDISYCIKLKFTNRPIHNIGALMQKLGNALQITIQHEIF